MIALAFTNSVFFSYAVYLLLEKKQEFYKSKLFWILLVGLAISLYITSLFIFKENTSSVIIGL
ncbi:MAG: hypothetical protein AAF573_06625 [Bacteroidota bacterium]